MLIEETYRNRWILFALAVGLIILLVVVLSYVALWREREAESEAQQPITDVVKLFAWFFRTFPWVLILTMVFTTALTIFYSLFRIVDPPNW